MKEVLKKFVVAIIISIIICTCLVNVERVLASGIPTTEGTTHYSNDYFEYDAPKSWTERHILTKEDIADSKNKDLVYGEGFAQNVLDFSVYKNVYEDQYSDEVYNKYVSKLVEGQKER